MKNNIALIIAFVSALFLTVLVIGQPDPPDFDPADLAGNLAQGNQVGKKESINEQLVKILTLQVEQNNQLQAINAELSRKVNSTHQVHRLATTVQNEELLKRHNVDLHYMIYQHYIDVDGPDGKADGLLDDVERLKARIAQVVPEGFRGCCWLDWEGVFLDKIKTGDPKAIEHAQIAIRAAKEVRPEARWGYYALPFRRYWDRNNPIWRQQNDNAKLALAECDIVGPSVYDFYENSLGQNQYIGDEAYVADNIGEALRIADGRPVYAFVMWVWHDSNPRVGNQEIPRWEFVPHAQAAIRRGAFCVVGWGGNTMPNQEVRFATLASVRPN